MPIKFFDRDKKEKQPIEINEQPVSRTPKAPIPDRENVSGPFGTPRREQTDKGGVMSTPFGAKEAVLFGDSKSPSTLLGKEIRFKGELHGSGSVQIEGEFDGTINLKEEIVILKAGIVRANIEADKITVKGKLEGNATARDKIVIEAGGDMIGDISSRQVIIQEKAFYKGFIKMPTGKEEAGRSKPTGQKPEDKTQIINPPQDRPTATAKPVESPPAAQGNQPLFTPEQKTSAPEPGNSINKHGSKRR